MRKAFLLTVALVAFAPSLTFAAGATPTEPLPPQQKQQPQAAAPFTDAQRAAIESIVKDYLTNKNPEVVADALQTLQKREQDTAEAKSKDQVLTFKDKIFNDPASPVGGNPKGDVTVVEFYDYQCGYCKMSEEGVDRLLKDDKNVKFIYKEFPILGAASIEAAKASVASVKQGKFQIFHDALMNKKEHLTSDVIYQIAKESGLNVEKLKKDMAEKSVSDDINDSLKLGQDIGVRGTPMFIINDNVYPGALQYEQLKKAVDDTRAAAKKS
ncbi:MAG: DsbA family protein [Alphaproteobacteria bacterium]|nr:DsbA family protein [Alphaproteobacteria bacterium]